MGKTSIEWTAGEDGTLGATWNPVRGCTKVSQGCKNCYAETFAERWRGIVGHPYEQGFDLRLVPEKLEEPLRWKKPRRVFVNSMSDLFQGGVPDQYIARVFAVMALARLHTFQVLTKRPARMAALLRSDAFIRDVEFELGNRITATTFVRWPLPNVWLGVSVEDQRAADVRIPSLLATPAAVRFLSVEPMLGPVQLGVGGCFFDYGVGDRARIDWVICGGESGPGARPFDVRWATAIRDLCTAARVPFFLKQLGADPRTSFYDELREEWECTLRGEWPSPIDWSEHDGQPGPDAVVRLRLKDRKGKDPAEWPEALRVRQWPEVR